MTNCIAYSYQFSKVKNRTIEINFTSCNIRVRAIFQEGRRNYGSSPDIA
ncbi:hypothetical protein [Rickettsia endosymbiont of Polydrusus tereticollis]